MLVRRRCVKIVMLILRLNKVRSKNINSFGTVRLLLLLGSQLLSSGFPSEAQLSLLIQIPRQDGLVDCVAAGLANSVADELAYELADGFKLKMAGLGVRYGTNLH